MGTFSAVGGLILGAFNFFAASKLIDQKKSLCTVPVRASVFKYESAEQPVTDYELSNQGTNTTARVWYPVFRYEYQGQVYTVRSPVSPLIKPKPGTVKIIKINPNNPREIFYKSNSVVYLFKGCGILIIVISLLSLIPS